MSEPPTSASASYKVNWNNTIGEFMPKYSNLNKIGAGAYGIVFSAYENSTGKNVAIKKLQITLDCNKLKRTLYELFIIKRMRHENITTTSDMFLCDEVEYNPPTKSAAFVMELVPISLHRRIHPDACADKLSPLTADEISKIICNVLRGVKYLHSCQISFSVPSRAFVSMRKAVCSSGRFEKLFTQVMHRDLKPPNILLNHNGNAVKICDFSLSRVVNFELLPLMTARVATLQYRAPEVFLTSGCYTQSVDLWSVGCTLAEMLTGQFLIEIAKSEIVHIENIFKVIGTPTEYQLDQVNGVGPETKSSILNMPQTEQKWPEEIRKSEVVLEFLTKLLKFVPGERLSAAEALEHRYLREHQHHRRPEQDEGVQIKFDEHLLLGTKADYLRAIEQEILGFHTDQHNEPNADLVQSQEILAQNESDTMFDDSRYSQASSESESMNQTSTAVCRTV